MKKLISIFLFLCLGLVHAQTYRIEKLNTRFTKGGTLTPSATGYPGGIIRVDSMIGIGTDPTAPLDINAVNDSLRIRNLPGTGNVLGIDAGGRVYRVDPGSAGIADGDKGDIDVSGAGTIWIVDTGAINSVKVSSIDAAKINESTSRRFVSDTEKTTWNGKQDALEFTPVPNTRTVNGKALSSNISIDKADVGLSSVPNVDATNPVNISQSSSYRFVTDAEKTDWNSKQDSLISGTNIKTINGNSVLGSGDLTITAADPSGYTVVIKSANQDVTNAGVTNDNDFFFSVTANQQYVVQFDLIISGNNTTADYTCDLRVDAGTIIGKGTYQGLTTAAAVANVIVTANNAANTTAVPTGAPTANLNDLVAVRITFAFTASNTTTFRFRFGNATPTTGATSRTWKGSVMKYKNIN